MAESFSRRALLVTSGVFVGTLATGTAMIHLTPEPSYPTREKETPAPMESAKQLLDTPFDLFTEIPISARELGQLEDNIDRFKLFVKPDAVQIVPQLKLASDIPSAVIDKNIFFSEDLFGESSLEARTIRDIEETFAIAYLLPSHLLSSTANGADVADVGWFMKFHQTLFDTQNDEGKKASLQTSLNILNPYAYVADSPHVNQLREIKNQQQYDPCGFLATLMTTGILSSVEMVGMVDAIPQIDGSREPGSGFVLDSYDSQEKFNIKQAIESTYQFLFNLLRVRDLLAGVARGDAHYYNEIDKAFPSFMQVRRDLFTSELTSILPKILFPVDK